MNKTSVRAFRIPKGVHPSDYEGLVSLLISANFNTESIFQSGDYVTVEITCDDNSIKDRFNKFVIPDELAQKACLPA